MALMPVCSGSLDRLAAGPPTGAWSSSGARSVSSIGPLPSSGTPSGSDHPAQEAVADRHRQHLAGAADLLALLDLAEVAQHHDADLGDVQVLGQAAGAVLEFQQLIGHGRGQALDPGDAVTALGDGPDLLSGGGSGS